MATKEKNVISQDLINHLYVDINDLSRISEDQLTEEVEYIMSSLDDYCV